MVAKVNQNCFTKTNSLIVKKKTYLPDYNPDIRKRPDLHSRHKANDDCKIFLCMDHSNLETIPVKNMFAIFCKGFLKIRKQLYRIDTANKHYIQFILTHN
jgi:hypothetical protein